MWRSAAAALAVVLSGCSTFEFFEDSAETGQTVEAVASRSVISAGTSAAVPQGNTHEPRRDCYTVKLFDPYRLAKPQEGTPVEFSRYVGVYKYAAWNGFWCHDLYVIDVGPDGTARILDAYGPNANQGREATIFQRTGRVQDGELRFVSLGGAKVKYRLSSDNKRLFAERNEGFRNYKATAERVDGLKGLPKGMLVSPTPPRRKKR